MRVTQSMLTVNTLRHVSQNYEKLGKIQDQLASGKKITRASQDPVVAMNGMRYRSQVVEIEQFKRNIGEAYNWMDTADAAMDKGSAALHRIRELTVQASNDTYDATQRVNIGKEVSQLFDHMVSMANSTSNGKYVFNGTDTMNPPVDPSKMDIGVSKMVDYEANTIPSKELIVSFKGKVFEFKEHVFRDGDSTNTNPNNILGMVFKNGNETITVENYKTPNPPYDYDPFVLDVDDAPILDADGKKVPNPEPDPNRLIISHEYPNIEYDPDATPTPDPEEATIKAVLSEGDIIVSERKSVPTNSDKVNIELLKGIYIDVNINPKNVFSNQLFEDIKKLETMLHDGTKTGQDFTMILGKLDTHMNNFVSERAELGARLNRVELIESRIMEQEVIAKHIMSSNEDADMEKVIINLKTQESIHRASLAAGSKIMQPTLMDFL